MSDGLCVGDYCLDLGLVGEVIGGVLSGPAGCAPIGEDIGICQNESVCNPDADGRYVAKGCSEDSGQFLVKGREDNYCDGDTLVVLGCAENNETVNDEYDPEFEHSYPASFKGEVFTTSKIICDYGCSAGKCNPKP